MDVNEIQRRVDEFPRWHYQLDLSGVRTPIFAEDHVNRHEQRRRYFFDPLVEWYGGRLAGKRVLDLGCNAGFWMLQALRAGCEHAVGIDGRIMHIEQAALVMEASDISADRYTLRVGNVFDVDFGGSFDVVLCLGLLYHVANPISLIEKIHRVNTETLVIDTALSSLAGPVLEVRHDPLDDPRAAVDCPLVLLPTKEAVEAIVTAFGYSVEVLEPSFTDWTGCEDYRQGARRAFLCTKGS